MENEKIRKRKKVRKVHISEVDKTVREWAKTQKPELNETEIRGIIFRTAILCDNVYI